MKNAFDILFEGMLDETVKHEIRELSKKYVKADEEGKKKLRKKYPEEESVFDDLDKNN